MVVGKYGIILELRQNSRAGRGGCFFSIPEDCKQLSFML